MLPVSHLTQQTSQVNQPVPTSPLATWLQAWNSASATSQAALAASSRFGRAWEDLFRFGGTNTQSCLIINFQNQLLNASSLCYHKKYMLKKSLSNRFVLKKMIDQS